MPCTSADDLDEYFEAYMQGRPLQVCRAPVDTDYCLVRYRQLGRMGILSKRIVDLSVVDESHTFKCLLTAIRHLRH